MRQITYHKEVPYKGVNEPTLPHCILDDKLKTYLENKEVKQDSYHFHDNGFYFFIYLNNGDRVDVMLD